LEIEKENEFVFIIIYRYNVVNILMPCDLQATRGVMSSLKAKFSRFGKWAKTVIGDIWKSVKPSLIEVRDLAVQVGILLFPTCLWSLVQLGRIKTSVTLKNICPQKTILSFHKNRWPFLKKNANFSLLKKRGRLKKVVEFLSI
jgi:hypothetical protein